MERDSTRLVQKKDLYRSRERNCRTGSDEIGFILNKPFSKRGVCCYLSLSKEEVKVLCQYVTDYVTCKIGSHEFEYLIKQLGYSTFMIDVTEEPIAQNL